jgi:deazaflavin-dependent oxidoreductase (nitroreductase family)
MAQHAPASAHKRASQVSTSQGKAPRLMIPIFKLPVVLYRLHLGWLLGTRFMQLTHIGRRSGRLHRTVLAVLRFDASTKELYAVSAWPGSDWYANIQAAPAVLVECGVVRYVPRQRILSPEEIAATFIDYRTQHPLFSRLICRIPGWTWDATYDEFLALAQTLHGVAFRPHAGNTTA